LKFQLKLLKKQYDFRNYKLITDSSTIRYSPTEKNNYFVVISSPMSIKNISSKPKGLLSLFKKSSYSNSKIKFFNYFYFKIIAITITSV